MRLINSKKLLVSILLLTAISFAQAQPPKVSAQRQHFITTSLGYIGVPYIYGADDWETYRGFDCSGFVQYAAKKSLGIQLPRTAQAMYDSCQHISVRDREPGDLVFFKNDPNGKITHVGIYLGVYHGDDPNFEGKRVFVSAVSDGPKTGVVISLMDERFWKDHYYASGRILPATSVQN